MRTPAQDTALPPLPHHTDRPNQLSSGRRGVTTTTPALGVTFVHAVQLLARHLANHQLPQPASLAVMTRAGRSTVTAQVHSDTVADVAAELLAWANTLTTVTVQTWRPPHGDGVHLSIASTLTGVAGAVGLDVYGGAADEAVLFADLAPGEHQDVPLGHLRAWAASVSDTPNGGAAV